MINEKIIVLTTVDVAAEKAWDYYTNPLHIVNWKFASDDWICPAAANEMHVGGRHFARMEAKDGSFGFDFEAVYDEIEMGKNFKYTMTDGRNLCAQFEDLKGNTKITLRFDPDQEFSPEMQREGWQAILNNFKKYVENH